MVNLSNDVRNELALPLVRTFLKLNHAKVDKEHYSTIMTMSRLKSRILFEIKKKS
jgi:hypothetical protein